MTRTNNARLTGWKAVKALWRGRRLFGPATSTLVMLTSSRRLDQTVTEFTAWMDGSSVSVVPLAHAADLWANEVESVANANPDSAVLLSHGLVIRSLATSARQLERAATRLAVEQQEQGESGSARVEMGVAFQRMVLALDELRGVVNSKRRPRE